MISLFLHYNLQVYYKSKTHIKLFFIHKTCTRWGSITWRFDVGLMEEFPQENVKSHYGRRKKRQKSKGWRIYISSGQFQSVISHFSRNLL